MRLAETLGSATRDDIKAALDGGKLVLYSTGRPPSADHAITRSEALATFVFASPAFGPDPEGDEGFVAPLFVEATVTATAIGTPGWARAYKADGSVVADFSAGPGATEIKLSSVSATAGFPLTISSIKFLPAETVEWTKTEYGHVYVTNLQDAHRKVSVRG